MSKTYLRAYFKHRNPEIIGSSTEHGNRVEIEMAMDQLPFKVNIPTYIRKEVGKYVFAHSTKFALAKFSKQYSKYTFKRTSINSWQAQFKNNGNSRNLKKIFRANLSSKELLKRVVKANDPGTIV